MSIKFDWHPTPQPGGRENSTHKHARVVPQGKINTEMLCKMISSSSSFSSSDVKGILEGLNFWINFYLSSGNSVELDGLGHFSPTLRTKRQKSPNGNVRTIVDINSVAFRCAPTLKQKLREAKLESVRKPETPLLLPEIRLKNILMAVEQQLSINTTTCMQLNSCTRYLALEDLKKLVLTGRLIAVGQGRQTLYIRPYRIEPTT